MSRTRRIDQRQRQPADVGLLGQQIPRRAGDRGDDRAVRIEQDVEQARLADVRRADNRHGRALADRRPRCGLRGSASMRAITPAIDLARFLRRDEVIALLRKIQRRLELRDRCRTALLDRE